MRQTSYNLVPYTPSPSPPASPSPTNIDLTYQVVSIKPSNTDWLTPTPSDLVQITGPASEQTKITLDDEDDDDDKTTPSASAFSDEEKKEEKPSQEPTPLIPCLAHLTWGASSLELSCLYSPCSAAIFTSPSSNTKAACRAPSGGRTDRAQKVIDITMQDAILTRRHRCRRSPEGSADDGDDDEEMMEDDEDEDEDVRDDNGNPFLVLHVRDRRRLGEKDESSPSARLYCKKVTEQDGRSGSTDGGMGTKIRVLAKSGNGWDGR